MQDAKRARMQDVETIRHGVTLVSGWEDKPLVELLEAAKRLPVKQIRLHVQVPLPTLPTRLQNDGYLAAYSW